MNKTRLFQKSVIAVALTLSTQQVFAAGFQLNAQSATGLGRAFAGDAVIADNASVIARNAAAMTLFDSIAFSGGFESITSMIEVSDATYTNALGTEYDANYDNAGDTSIAPNLHLIVPIDDKLSLGATIYSNFGTKTNFDSDYVAAEYGGNTEISSLNIGVVSAYRLSPQWSIGGGIDFIYGEGTLKRNLSSDVGLPGFGGAETLNIDSASGWAVGFNVGTVYELDADNRFGFSYHYSPELKAKDGSQSVTLPLPDMAEFSGFHKLENSPFAVHYSIQFIGWSSFDKITFENASIEEKEYKWKDAFHYSIGGTYFLNDTWTLRAGYMYDESAQDKVTSISVPDSDRQWFSAGVGYQLSQKATVDFGFTYLLGKDVEVEESTALGGPYSTSLSGTTHADAILMGLQYSRTF
ncbi:outer membrane protein transport protein [Vibrio sp. RC27]